MSGPVRGNNYASNAFLILDGTGREGGGGCDVGGSTQRIAGGQPTGTLHRATPLGAKGGRKGLWLAKGMQVLRG